MSGWVGADAVAPFSTSVPNTIVYVPEDGFIRSLELLTSRSEVTQVDRGGRIRLRTAPRHVFAFVSEAHGQPIVSPVRIYGDLVSADNRGADAAEHLREVAIGF
ncbi:hypothetical protein L2X99_10455 [Microbacterium sp. KUDC0406]|uniref:type IV toxin-antitoxin system AbiEi family antitoxin n=1 Tax=Microbacterium sp. KUDC0406 TaxID=2909588 RepID=UPI001F3909A8|nr:type IV toxin-antitoxin system AbiEi family antitoxin [Microbacterium sp. KUDC0406]UJP08905.1 hypothetical protein L2X99_10455 [Microbacterium sp. KUDC0406]